MYHFVSGLIEWCAIAVQKEPPFKLNESGYAGFVFPIDVYFRNPGHPKKIRFLYDLSLDRRRSTTHIRCEKLTFRNPPELFQSLLIKGGGVSTITWFTDRSILLARSRVCCGIGSG